MGFPQFKLLSGVVDGINLVFTTPTPYTAGTLAVYLNGQLLLNPTGNPWSETDPSTGTVTLAAECTPIGDDVVAAFYIDTSTDPLQTEITPIAGSLTAESAVSGQLASTEALTGSVVPSEPIHGILAIIDTIQGGVQAISSLSGTIEDV